MNRREKLKTTCTGFYEQEESIVFIAGMVADWRQERLYKCRARSDWTRRGTGGPSWRFFLKTICNFTFFVLKGLNRDLCIFPCAYVTKMSLFVVTKFQTPCILMIHWHHSDTTGLLWMQSQVMVSKVSMLRRVT